MRLSDRDVIEVLDKNIFCGVMGAKTPTEGIQEKIIAETIASVDNYHQSFVQKRRQDMVMSPKRKVSSREVFCLFACFAFK